MKTKGAALAQMSLDNLTERIGVIFYETTRDNRGNIIKGEENIRCMLWAKVLPLTGKINDSTPERINTITYRVTIRYRTDILPDDKIIWRSKTFRLITPPIDLDNFKRWTQFDVVEVIQDGYFST